MRILAVLWIVSLVGLCHGKGGNKKPPTQPATHTAKGQTQVRANGQQATPTPVKATQKGPVKTDGQTPPKAPTAKPEAVPKQAPQQAAKPAVAHKGPVQPPAKPKEESKATQPVKKEQGGAPAQQGVQTKPEAAVPQNQKPGEKAKQAASVGQQGDTPTPVKATQKGPVKTNGTTPPKAPTQPGSVPEFKPQQPAANLQGGAKQAKAPQEEAKEEKVLTQPVQESTPTEPKEESAPLSERAKKVDSAMFDVSESNSDGVPLLTCTPKPDVSANELKYGDDTIWDGEDSSLSSALIYFKGDEPYVVTLQAERDGEDVFFLHYNGKEWEHNKKEHERKLCGLKGLPVPQSAGQDVTLDLANPDDSNINVDEQNLGGVLLKSYFPKKGHHISSVVDGGVTLWEAEGEEKGISVQSHVKGSTVMTIGIKSGDDLEAKFFENGGSWVSIEREDFFNRLDEMSGLPKASQ